MSVLFRFLSFCPFLSFYLVFGRPFISVPVVVANGKTMPKRKRKRMFLAVVAVLQILGLAACESASKTSSLPESPPVASIWVQDSRSPGSAGIALRQEYDRLVAEKIDEVGSWIAVRDLSVDQSASAEDFREKLEGLGISHVLRSSLYVEGSKLTVTVWIIDFRTDQPAARWSFEGSPKFPEQLAADVVAVVRELLATS